MRQISWYVSVNAKNKTAYGNIHNTKYTDPKNFAGCDTFARKTFMVL